MKINVKQLIANVLFFKGLSEEEIDDIHRIASERHYQRNQMVFSDGEEGAGFFLVVEGSVKVFKMSPEGKEQILHILGPGEPVGQVAVFAGRLLSGQRPDHREEPPAVFSAPVVRGSDSGPPFPGAQHAGHSVQPPEGVYGPDRKYLPQGGSRPPGLLPALSQRRTADADPSS
jgi:hypothetical protein